MQLLRAIFLILLFIPTQSKAQLSESLEVLNAVNSKAKFYTLSNGLRVILYRRDLAPVFSGVVGVRVGGVDETVGHTGISHMLEHMAFKGTEQIGTTDFSREKVLLDELEQISAQAPTMDLMNPQQKSRWEEIQKELRDLWVTDGFTREYEKRGADDLNANTGKELTKYYVSFPRSTFEFWCEMEAERIIHPVLRQFYQERDVVMEERRMRYEDDPEGKLYELLLSMVFQSHPYRNPVIGFGFDIKRLTASMVEDFHRRYYVPENIVVGVVGDVDPESDIRTIEKYFGKIPRGTVPARTTAVEAAQQGERRITLSAASSPQLFIAYRKPQYPDPEDPPISLMGEMLAGGRLSPLYTELVKRRQLATSVGYTEEPGNGYPNMMVFMLTPRTPHTTDELLKAFDEVLRKFQRGPIDPELLEIAKHSFAVDHLAQLKSNLSTADSFVTSELIYNDWKISLRWFQDVMAVTPQEVLRVVQKYLVRDGRTIAQIESQK